MWDEITFQLPNFNCATVEVREWIRNLPHTLLSMWLYIHVGIKVSPCKGPVTLPKIRVNAWITHKIWLCVLVRREFDHFCWLTWWKITDELRKNYGKITHKSLINHTLQRIGTKRPQTGRMRGCAWRIRDGKPRIISALSLVNCVWIAHDSRMNCAKNAQEALKLRSFRAYKTDAAGALAFPFQLSQAAHRFFKFVKFSFFIRVRATQNSDHKWELSNIGFITVHGQNM